MPLMPRPTDVVYLPIHTAEFGVLGHREGVLDYASGFKAGF